MPKKRISDKDPLKYIIIIVIILLALYLIYKTLTKPEVLPGPLRVSRIFDKTSAYIG